MNAGTAHALKGARSAKTKMVGGRMVSAKSKTGNPACSMAMSAWKTSGMTKDVAAVLAKCRSQAKQNKHAEHAQASGKLAEGRGTWQRSEKAAQLVAKRAEARPVPAAAAPSLTMRAQADAHRAKEGTIDRAAKAAKLRKARESAPVVVQRAGRRTPGEAIPPRPANASRNIPRAPAGGMVSDVTGSHYAGGRIIPVHGNYAGMEKKPSQGKGGGGGPAVGKETKPREPRPRVERDPFDVAREHAQAKQWRDVQASPLGGMMRLGDQPGRMFQSSPQTKPWQAFAEHTTTERLTHIQRTAKAAYLRQARAQSKPGESKAIREHAKWIDSDAQSGTGSYMGARHVKKTPGSVKANHWLRYAIDQKTSIDTMHGISRSFTEPIPRRGIARTAKPVPAPATARPARDDAFSLAQSSAFQRKRTEFVSSGGSTGRMFDMKKGDLAGQTSIFDRVATVSTHTALSKGRGTLDRMNKAKQLRGAREPLHAFADRVHATANTLKGGAAGDTKAFITDVHAAAGGGLTMDAFKQKLLKAHQAGHLELGRADIIAAYPRSKLDSSATPHFGTNYHFVRTDPRKARR